MRTFAVALTLALLQAQSAQAIFTTYVPRTMLHSRQIENWRGGAELEGYVTNDLAADFNGPFTGAQLLVELDSGTIYHHPIGYGDPARVIFPPNGAWLEAFPALEYDTFLGVGYRTTGREGSEPVAGGGAVDLGGDPTAVFSNLAINQAWSSGAEMASSGAERLSTAAVTTDRASFFLARVTLSDDAAGTAHFLLSAGGVSTIWRDLPIAGGVIVVPEPATMALSVFSLIALLGARCSIGCPKLFFLKGI